MKLKIKKFSLFMAVLITVPSIRPDFKDFFKQQTGKDVDAINHARSINENEYYD